MAFTRPTDRSETIEEAIYVFGTKNECFRYRISTNDWEDLTPTAPMPWDGRVDHVRYMAAFGLDNTVYVFSGDADVFRYNASVDHKDADAWTQLEAKQDCRYGKQAVFAVYEFDFIKERRVYAGSKDAWCYFDVNTNVWEVAGRTSEVPRWIYETSFGPITQWGTTDLMVFSDKGLYIFGTPENGRWGEATVQGQRPPWRDGATMVTLEAFRGNLLVITLYLFGGRSADGPLDDLWLFAFGEHAGRWSQAIAAKPWPAPRAAALLATPDVRGRKFYLFGGGQPLEPKDKDVWVCDASNIALLPTTTITVTSTATTSTSTASTTTSTTATTSTSTVTGTTTTTTSSSVAWIVVAVVLGVAVLGAAAGFAYCRLQRPARAVAAPEEVGTEMALTTNRH